MAGEGNTTLKQAIPTSPWDDLPTISLIFLSKFSEFWGVAARLTYTPVYFYIAFIKPDAFSSFIYTVLGFLWLLSRELLI